MEMKSICGVKVQSTSPDMCMQ